MKFLKEKTELILKGLWIGATMMVPGVSGGTMAMLLGIYDSLIKALNGLRTRFRESFPYLAVFGVSAVIGMVLFSIPVSIILEKFPVLSLYFFIGAVCGGVPLILRSAKIKKPEWSVLIYPVLGFAVAFAIGKLPEGLFVPDATLTLKTVILLLVAGVVLAVALILPGISVSYMLLVLGLYETVVNAVKGLQILVLLPLVIGVLVGSLATAQVMEKAMAKYPRGTYLIILGFIIGSVVEIFPGITLGNLIPAIILFALGFVFIYTISKKEEAAN